MRLCHPCPLPLSAWQSGDYNRQIAMEFDPIDWIRLCCHGNRDGIGDSIGLLGTLDDVADVSKSSTDSIRQRADIEFGFDSIQSFDWSNRFGGSMAVHSNGWHLGCLPRRPWFDSIWWSRHVDVEVLVWFDQSIDRIVRGVRWLVVRTVEEGKVKNKVAREPTESEGTLL